jgi:hypothetical protein
MKESLRQLKSIKLLLGERHMKSEILKKKILDKPIEILFQLILVMVNNLERQLELHSNLRTLLSTCHTEVIATVEIIIEVQMRPHTKKYLQETP